ncbi:unnamed protein product [Ostreobium quekettii]|uniref:Uncharacterized protein n=1 Tax=Ostreobium quekettii TaxID=121088 RepID=A0A8S1IUB6_9CHLO|nr:unnamed protein product [Ostreobium quekettii]|eukprot:evm.model.scf_1.20 EVM.evm.TU.scf_1.20   scf_1:346662-351526(+)
MAPGALAAHPLQGGIRGLWRHPQRSRPPFASDQRSRIGGPGKATGRRGVDPGQAKEMDGPPFCIPADGVFCDNCSWMNGTCLDGECEGLHISKEDRAAQRQWPELPSGAAQLIIAAGPERSGSTWLFNAVRLLFKSAHQPLDAFWISTLTDTKLDMRGVGSSQHSHVLIKTHQWSNLWTVERASHVFVTHRDLRGVVASYRRVGWAHTIPDSYVEDHLKWKAIAHKDFAFERIVHSGIQELEALAAALGIVNLVDIHSVNEELKALRPPMSGAPHPITKLWPRHMSPSVLRTLENPQGSKASVAGSQDIDMTEEGSLCKRFPGYMKDYGYM